MTIDAATAPAIDPEAVDAAGAADVVAPLAGVDRSALADPGAPITYRREQLAALLQVSVDKLDQMRAAGRIPNPWIHEEDSCGRTRTVLWSRRDVLDWWDAGAPDADTWAIEVERRRVSAARKGRGRTDAKG